MKVRINFLKGTHVEAENASVTSFTDEKWNILVELDNGYSIKRYLISTIASIEFSTEKPQLAVTNVLIFGK